MWEGSIPSTSLQIRLRLPPKLKTAIWTVRSAERLGWIWNRNSDRGRGVRKLDVEQTPSHNALHIFMHDYCNARGECILHACSETSSEYRSLRDTCLKDLSATVKSLHGHLGEREWTEDTARWSSCSFDVTSDHDPSTIPRKDIAVFALNWMVYTIQNALFQSNAPFEIFLMSETKDKQATYLEICRDDGEMCQDPRLPKELQIKILMTKPSAQLSRSTTATKQEAVAKNRRNDAHRIAEERILYRKKTRVRVGDIDRLSSNPLSRVSQRSDSKNAFSRAVDSNWTLWLKTDYCRSDSFLNTMKAAVRLRDSAEESSDCSNTLRQSSASSHWNGNPIVAIVAVELCLIDVLSVFQTERNGRCVFPKVSQFIRRIRCLLKDVVRQESSTASCFAWETLQVRSMSYTLEVMQVTRSPKLRWTSPVADNVQLAYVESITSDTEMRCTMPCITGRTRQCHCRTATSPDRLSAEEKTSLV